MESEEWAERQAFMRGNRVSLCYDCEKIQISVCVFFFLLFFLPFCQRTTTLDVNIAPL